MFKQNIQAKTEGGNSKRQRENDESSTAQNNDFFSRSSIFFSVNNHDHVPANDSDACCSTNNPQNVFTPKEQKIELPESLGAPVKPAKSQSYMNGWRCPSGGTNLSFERSLQNSPEINRFDSQNGNHHPANADHFGPSIKFIEEEKKYQNNVKEHECIKKKAIMTAFALTAILTLSAYIAIY